MTLPLTPPTTDDPRLASEPFAQEVESQENSDNLGEVDLATEGEEQLSSQESPLSPVASVPYVLDAGASCLLHTPTTPWEPPMPSYLLAQAASEALEV